LNCLARATPRGIETQRRGHWAALAHQVKGASVEPAQDEQRQKRRRDHESPDEQHGIVAARRLKLDRRRPLWIVYDEAHNTTTDQVELLDDLNPAGFFVASASHIKGKLQFYLTSLPEAVRNERIVPISTRAVVDAQLLKSTISLADYDSSTDEMIADVVKRRENLHRGLIGLSSSTIPKAIYVMETSNVRGKDADESRPVAIWRTLVNLCKVPPESIAVCTNTKDLPRDAIRVENIDQLSDQFTHIIFNKKLQEGWDDLLISVEI